MEPILSFFTKLVENSPQLIILFLGAILVFLSGTNQLPIANSQVVLSHSVQIGLALIGSLLIVFALWILYGNEKLRRSKRIDNLEKESADLSKKLEDEKHKIKQKDEKVEELEHIIAEALKVSKEKGFDEIARILSNATQVLRDADERFKPLVNAAHWANAKANSWIKIIEPSKYKDYGIRGDNVEEFRQEILQHLNLLESNLREMIPDTIPRLRDVPQKVATNPLAYSAALKAIQSQMEKDLEKSTPLDTVAREQLLAYMSELIEKTTA